LGISGNKGTFVDTVFPCQNREESDACDVLFDKEMETRVTGLWSADAVYYVRVVCLMVLRLGKFITDLLGVYFDEKDLI
jgi:hypothetical protein